MSCPNWKKGESALNPKRPIADRIEAHIQELEKTRSETVRKSIEKSIEKLEATRKEAEEKTAYVYSVISNIENVVKNGRDLFADYLKSIRWEMRT